MTAYKINQGEYLIYEDGRLFNLKNSNYKKWTKDTNGYMRCTIWNLGKPIMVSQHRLLAEIFIPNPENKPQVNHINGVKHDNRLENLEWVTASENGKHSFAVLSRKPTKPHMRKVINIDTKEIYESIAEAARQNSIHVVNLCGKLNGRINNNTNLKFYE